MAKNFPKLRKETYLYPGSPVPGKIKQDLHKDPL